MAGYFRGSLTYTWTFLAFATLAGGWLGAENDCGHALPHALIPVLVVLIALIKVRVVMRSYMEVRLAPSWLGLACDAWLILNLGMVSSFYWLVS